MTHVEYLEEQLQHYREGKKIFNEESAKINAFYEGAIFALEEVIQNLKEGV